MSAFCLKKVDLTSGLTLHNSVQSAAFNFQGFVKSLLGSSAGWMAILQLLCSQARRKLLKELLKKINRTSRNDLTPAAV